MPDGRTELRLTPLGLLERLAPTPFRHPGCTGITTTASLPRMANHVPRSQWICRREVGGAEDEATNPVLGTPHRGLMLRGYPQIEPASVEPYFSPLVMESCLRAWATAG